MNLIKYFVTGFIIGAGLFYGVNAFAADPRVKTQMLDPVVKINDSCSAGFIDSGGIGLLTAAHCVSGGPGYISYTVKDEKTFKVTYEGRVWYDVEKVDVPRDLALLRLRDKNYKPDGVAKVADTLKVEIGDNVWAVGYPLAATKNISVGLFNGVQIEEFISGNPRPKFRSTPDVDNGNSGGFLFQEVSGNYEVIGVTSMKYGKNTFMNLFVTLDDIQYFLKTPIVKPSMSATVDVRLGAQ